MKKGENSLNTQNAGYFCGEIHDVHSPKNRISNTFKKPQRVYLDIAE
jgi:hypothetical protein